MSWNCILYYVLERNFTISTAAEWIIKRGEAEITSVTHTANYMR